MTIYRKDDEDPGRNDSFRMADSPTDPSSASLPSSEGSGETTQAMPPLTDPVLITPEEAEGHNHGRLEAKGQESAGQGAAGQEAVSQVPGHPFTPGLNPALNPEANQSPEKESPLESTQVFNPFQDDDFAPLPSSGQAAQPEQTGQTGQPSQQSQAAASGAGTETGAATVEDPSLKPSVLPDPDFETATLLFPTLTMPTGETGTPKAAADSEPTMVNPGPAAATAAAAAKATTAATTATTPVAAADPSLSEETTNLAPVGQSAGTGTASDATETATWSEDALSPQGEATANTPDDQLDPTLEQLVTDFGEDTTDGYSSFGTAGTRGTTGAAELGDGGASAVERRDADNQRKLIIATLATLVAVVVILALTYGGLAIRRAMRQTELSNALSTCQATTASLNTASGKLKSQLTNAESLNSSVSASDVDDPGTVNALSDTLTSAQTLTSEIEKVESCDTSMAEERLSDITKTSQSLADRANKTATTLKSNAAAVQKSQAAKAKSDARISLQTKVDDANLLYTSSKDRVQDDQTRVNLKAAIDKASALLKRPKKSLETSDYTDEQKNLEQAMTAVNNSVSAKEQADKAERERQEQLRRQEEEDARKKAQDGDSDQGDSPGDDSSDDQNGDIPNGDSGSSSSPSPDNSSSSNGNGYGNSSNSRNSNNSHSPASTR